MDLDIYYRALNEYRKHTKEERDLEAFRRAVSSSDTAGDRIEIIKTNCIIEEDWIQAIEKGLVHVEKALAEERQFIRSNGEVVPIEKVKQVSKDSVDHLARHSNLLTRMPEKGKGIIPDGLYTVERLADYAVYENRFLYMMLCFLRDFISFRYEKIVELTNTYDGSLEIKKNVHRGGRSTVFEIKLKDKIKNDWYLKEHNPVKDKIERIDLILKTVIAFLNTPLMEFVAKSPMLKPPITETNVLRMNKNFKGAKELYYFISSYDKAGYSVERKTEVISPFDEDTADEFAEVLALTSFLTYEHGLGIENELKASFEKQERELKRLEKLKRDEQLKSLKKKIKQSGKSEPEYVLMLEQRNKELESDSAHYFALKEEYLKTVEEVKSLDGAVSELNGKIEDMTESHAAELKKAADDAADKIAEITKRSEEELSEKVAVYNGELNRITAEYNDKIAAQREECENILFNAEVEKNEKLANYNALLARLDKTLEEKRLLEARLTSALIESGKRPPEEDFTTPESFDEIENQYKAFKKFFNERWKTAKKQIRREALSAENIRKMSEKKYDYDLPKPDVDMESVLGKSKPAKTAKSEDKEEKKLLTEGKPEEENPEENKGKK